MNYAQAKNHIISRLKRELSRHTRSNPIALREKISLALDIEAEINKRRGTAPLFPAQAVRNSVEDDIYKNLRR